VADDVMMRLEEARARILEGVRPLSADAVPLASALGRVAAEDVHARLTLPPWDNSAMDGFAVRSADVRAATADAPVRLRVVGESAAGHAPSAGVGAGTAVRVLTGGLLPEGADSVVPVEDTDAPAGVADLPGEVLVRVAVAPGRHVRRAGSDLVEGDVVLAAGTHLGPAAIAVLAASGHARVSVHGRPRLAVLATGDELVPVGQALGPQAIPDSNTESLAAQATEAGADVLRLGIARDDVEDVRARMVTGIAASDVVVVSGGVSVGAHDVVKSAFEALGRLELWRVAIQPGKPLAYGRAAGPGGGRCHLFGLPGNPVSSFVTFELFVRPLLRRLAGERDSLGRLTVRAQLAQPVRTSLERRAFLRVRLETDTSSQAGYRAHTAGEQGSHVLSALALADGLAVIPEGVQTLPEGAEVEVIRLDAQVD
jgi:molybdopterin molybdotransferase